MKKSIKHLCGYFVLFALFFTPLFLHAQTITTVAGTGTGGFSGDGGAATAATVYNPYDAAFDAAGNIYIADYTNHRIRKINTSGVISTIAGTGTSGYSGDGGDATAARLNSPIGLTVDAAGNVYIADYGNQRVRKVTTAGVITTVAGTGTIGSSGDRGAATAAGLYNPSDVVLDTAGNIYIADCYNQRIRRVNTSGIITTYAGTGSASFSGDGGLATAATFQFPIGIEIDRSGQLYIADQSNRRIRKITASGIISTIAGTGTASFSGDGGAATAATFSTLITSVAKDAAGNIYVGDGNNYRIRKIDTAGIISTYAGIGSAGYTGDGGPATAASMSYYPRVAVDAAGNLLIGDALNNAVRIIRSLTSCSGTPTAGTAVASPSTGSTTTTFNITLTGATSASGLSYQWQQSATGAAGSFTNISGATDSTYSFTGITTNTYYRAVVSCSGAGDSSVAALVTVSSTAACNIITTIAGNGSVGYSGDSSAATAAAISNAYGVATDVFGNIYIADYDNNRIRKVTPTGIISTVAGTGTASYSGDGGAATAATLNSPTGVACDTSGNLYIADYLNSRVRKVSTSGIITTFAGIGTATYSGDGGPATAAGLYYPFSVAVDENNYIYIGDYGSNRIRRVVSSGIITTIAGTGTSGYSGDGGAATSATLSNANGIASDGSGNIYFSDYSNSRIRKISTSGIISTIAGTGTVGYSGDGGAATSATISYPTGITSDIYGNLYFNDIDNNVVRKISTSGIISTVGGTGVLGFSGDGGVATAARLSLPTGLAIDGSGKLYILDNDNARLRVVSGGPVVGAITGPSSVAVGSSITLSDTTAGGTWSSGSPTIASISSSGVVTGVAVGLARISYSVTGTCGTTMVTYAVTVTGATSSCTGTPTAGTAVATPSAGSTTTTFNITLTGATSGGGLSYQWQQSATGATGSFTNISGATDSTYSFTGITTNTYYRAVISCSGAGDSSVAALVTATPGPSLVATPPSLNFGTIASSSTSSALSTTVVGSFLVPATGTLTIAASTNFAVSSSVGGTYAMSYTTSYTGGAVAGHIIYVKFNAPSTPGSYTGSVTVTGGGVATPLYIPLNGNVSSSSSCSGTPTAGTAVATPTSGTATTNFTLSLTGTTTGTGLTYQWQRSTAGLAGPFSNISGVTNSSYAFTGVTSNTYFRAVVSCGSLRDTTDAIIINFVSSTTCNIITTIMGTGVSGYSGDGGPATAASMTDPYGVTVDRSGEVYFTDANNGRLRKVSTSGIVTTVAGTGTPGWSGDGGPATAARVSVSGIAFDASGNLYFTDASNNRVRRISTSGIITTIAGTGTTGSSGDGGAATAATFFNPSSIAIDSAGNIFVCDANSYKIRKINTSGIISTYAGRGGTGSSGDGGLATIAFFGQPMGIALDAAGNLYVADRINNKVRVVNTSGIINTFAGTGTVGVSGDGGAATAAQMNGPVKVTTDRLGNVYVSDHMRVRKINTSGIITTFAGNGTAGYAGDGGLATAAEMYFPEGLSIDNTGNMYIADHYNFVIRKVSSGNPVVANITGPTSVNVSASITLTNATTGGAWSTSAASIASVSSTGVVTGLSAGTAIITYLVSNSCGSSFDTALIRVNAVACTGTPAAGTINATDTIRCTGYSSVLTLTSATSGTGISYQWQISTDGTSWANITGATNNSYTATVSATAYYRAVITCTVGSTSSSSANTPAVLLTLGAPLRPVITGPDSVCQYDVLTYTSSSPGGTWVTSNPFVTSISTTGGALFVYDAGIDTIRHTVTNICGSTTGIKPIVSNPAPNAGAITGLTSICIGDTTTLTNSVTGGTWLSLNPTIANINAAGLVTGLTNGTAIIYYVSNAVCGSDTAIHAILVSGSASAGTISGLTSVCVASSIRLSSTVTGGSWTTASTSLASVNSTTGDVYGLSAGSASITYTVASSCGTAVTSYTVTVITTASSGTISGPSSVCTGSTITLATTGSGGSWVSASASVATVNPATGVVGGVSAGTAVISYTVTGSCGAGTAITTITVSNPPSAGTITGPTTVCAGSVITLTNATTGGTWSSGTPAIATIDGTGVVTGVATGTVTLSYGVAGGSCGTIYATYTISVTPSGAGTITGTAFACPATTVTLSNAVTGGTWTSSNPSVASISSTGVVNAIATGTSTISYAVTGICGTAVATRTFVVNPLPFVGTISGSTIVCPGSTTTLTNTVAGGTWSSVNPAIASVTTTGVVRGNTAGTTLVSYSVTNSCGTAATSASINVNPSATAGTIMGATSVCAGGTTTLTDSVAGGTWSSSAPGTASISSAGVVTGIATGSANITYTVINSCGTATTSRTITVNALPDAGIVSGASTTCVGATTTLTTTGSAGTWTSSNATIASVDATGVVTAIAAGTARISYTVTNGCGTDTASALFTVLASPVVGAITGTTTLCTGATAAYTNAATGGAWSSGDLSVASVNSTTGLAFGVANGTTNITYTLTNACGSDDTTLAITVTSTATAGFITGSSPVCQGATTTLTSSVSGGVWSSNNTTIASISTSGVVFGVAGGSTTISYLVTTACGTSRATFAMSVNPLPSPGTISGVTSLCPGTTSTLTPSTTGGVWSSTSPAIASVTTAGVVRGNSVGTTIIAYTLTNSCGSRSVTTTVNVNSVPSAGSITGAATVCAGDTTTLADSVTGGTWSSGSPTIASVDGSGRVTGIAAGTAVISYSVSSTCSTAVATRTITVSGGPSAGTLSGPSAVCTGSSVTLSGSVSGGTFSSSDSTIATVTATTGSVTGISIGAVTISYAVSGSCGVTYATRSLTVGTPPSAGTVSGTATICRGLSAVFSDTTSGGTWSSSNTSVASVSTAGIVTGIAGGTATISYTVTNSCGSASAIAPVTVISVVSAGTISGPTSVCTGSTITLIDTTVGGTWSSSNPAIASVSTTGVVTGVAAGSATIFYTVSTSCGSATASHGVTVIASATAGTITGTTTLCTATTTTLGTTGSSGGTWVSSNPAVASVTTTGTVRGNATGTATISYSVTGSCGVTVATTTVTIINTATAGAITGATRLCASSATTLSVSAIGGVWTSSDPSVASVSSTGVVTGNTAGTATITYAVTSTCGSATATHAITIDSIPTVSRISGSTTVCTGTPATYIDSVWGGTWATAATTIATIDAAGTLTGVAAGTTTVSYSLSNSCGTALATLDITVNLSPVAGSISGTTSICAGTTSTLTATTTGGVWSSSDTTIAIVSATGTVTAIATGSATISYTVTNTCGTATATTAVTVISGATAGTISGVTTICAGAATALTSTVAGGTWVSSNTTVATVNTSGNMGGVSAGAAIISYMVMTTCGTALATTSVTVNPAPRAAAISGTPSLCTGTSATFTDSVSGGTWASSNPSVASVSTTGIVAGISAGTAVISYTVTNSCGSSTATYNVTVSSPGASVTLSGASTVCAGAAIVLIPSITGGSFTSSSTSVATVSPTGVVTGITAGTTLITYTLTTACGTSSATYTITVNAAGSAGVISGATFICTGSVSTLTSTVAGGTWASSNPSVASVSTTGLVTGISVGTAVISYSVSTTCGTATTTTTVTIGSGGPAGSITPAGSATLCNSTPVSLSISSATATTYQWYKNGTLLAGATATTYTATTPGTYTAVVGNGCGIDTLAAVNVVLPPNPVISAAGGRTLTTGSFASYQWYLNGVAIPGATSAVYTFTASGRYTVRVTDGNGCAVTSAVYVASIGTTAVNTVTNLTDINIYPNPSTAMVYIEATVRVNVTVLNAIGQVVINQKDATEINLSQFAAGAYLFRISNENNELLKTATIMKAE